MCFEEKRYPCVTTYPDGEVMHGTMCAFSLKNELRKLYGYDSITTPSNNLEKNQVVIEGRGVYLYNGADDSAGLLLMPMVVDVSILNNKVVVLSFADLTETKAVLSEDDTFSVEHGVAICMMKKLIQMTFGNNCTSVYNKLVEIGMNVYNNKLADIEKKKKAEAEEAERSAKRYAKAQRRKAKRAERIKAAQDAEREAQIEIQKEAYLRAMREYNTSLNVSAE